MAKKEDKQEEEIIESINEEKEKINELKEEIKIEENKLSNDEYIDNVIKRINELKAITKERDLTKKELEEREKLRKIFIENFRNNFKSMLDNIEIVDKKDK